MMWTGQPFALILAAAASISAVTFSGAMPKVGLEGGGLWTPSVMMTMTLRLRLGEVGDVLVEIAEGPDEVAVAGEGVEEIEPAEDRLDVGLARHALRDLGLGGLAEAEQVEGVAVAQVVLDDGRDDEVGDVLEIGEDALRDVEEHDDVGRVGVRGRSGRPSVSRPSR